MVYGVRGISGLMGLRGRQPAFCEIRKRNVFSIVVILILFDYNIDM